jgi:hypothetical protein
MRRVCWILLVIALVAASVSPAETPAAEANLATTPPGEWTPQMLGHYQHSPRYKAWLAATKFFLRAQCDHQIPAYSSEAGSKFEGDMGPLGDLWTVAYPVSFTFRVTRPHDEALYCYTVTKKSYFAQWHFEDAWKRTKSGKRIARLSIPR